MTRLRHIWRLRHHQPAQPPMLSAEQERAWAVLRALMRAYDGAVDEVVRAEFDQFARDVERIRAPDGGPS